MSYLNNDYLSKEEEIAINNAEFDDMIKQNPPSKLRNLHPSVYSKSCFQPKYDHYSNQLISIPIKIDLRRKSRNSFIIDMDTYRHILQILESRHGDKTPVNNQFDCLSISIVTLPNTHCCLYYRPNDDSSDKFYLIGEIQTQSKSKKFTIPCPYSDSYFNMKQIQPSPEGYSTLYFNWLYNSSAGRIIPFAYRSRFYIPDPNGLMPWLSYQMYGSYLITGLTDHITFNITFVLDSRSPIIGRRQMAVRRIKEIRKQEHQKHRHVDHTPRQMLGDPGEIQYEIPSQEYVYYSDEEDPLLKALK